MILYNHRKGTNKTVTVQEETNMFNVAEILKVVNDNYYGVVAIRHCSEDEDYKVGDICRNSYDWNHEADHSTYEDEEPVELDGTCGYRITNFVCLAEDEVKEATELFNKALEESGCYCGRVVVIAGERCSYGEDLNEVIIEDTVVIAVEE